MRLPWALRTKYISIFSAASKSAMTPSFIGRTGLMFDGVRPEHLVRLDANCFDLAARDVEGHDGGLVEDDAAAPRENAGVGGSEIDCHVGGEGGHQVHGNSASFAEKECDRAQFMIRSSSLSAPNLKSFRNL